jgi:hypothetical protein
MEARENISRDLEEYNQDHPHRGVGNRTPKEALGSFAVLTKKRGPDLSSFEGSTTRPLE